MLGLPGVGTLSITAHDRNAPVLLKIAVAGLVASTAVGVLGVPPVGLHLPTHELGIMTPTCGATRSVARAAVGDLAGSWRFNPLGAVLVVGAWVCVAREVVGRTTGHWLDVRLSVTTGGRFLAAALVVALAVNQQLHADLLM